MRHNSIISSIRRSDVFNIVWVWEDNPPIFPPSVEWSFTACVCRYSILFSATVPLGREPHYSPISPLQAPQQPTIILQQLPAPMMPPGSMPSIRLRPGGHVKKGMAGCHHTQTESQDFTLTLFLPVCHITSFSASTQIFYLWSTLQLGQLYEVMKERWVQMQKQQARNRN